MIAHLEDGYLAEHKNAADLARGMRWILSYDPYESLFAQCRKAAVRRFSSELAAEKHVMLYRELLDKTK